MGRFIACPLITYVKPFRLFVHESMGPLQNPRLCVAFEDGVSDARFLWQVFYNTISEGVYRSPKDIELYLEQLLPLSGFVLCPGIKEYPEEIRFQTKNLCQWGMPFNRKFSATCYQWHVPCNYKQPHSSTAYDCWKPCKQLLHDINQLASRATTTTVGRKRARTFPSLNYHISSLSPASQKVRAKKTIDERKNMA